MLFISIRQYLLHLQGSNFMLINEQTQLSSNIQNKKVLSWIYNFIYQSMLCVEDQEKINKIVDSNLQTLRKRLKQFAKSALIKAKANRFQNPFELISDRISYFSEKVTKRKLQEIAAAIFQAQKEQKIQEIKPIAIHQLDKEMEEEEQKRQVEIKKSKKAKAIAKNQSISKNCRFLQMIQNDLAQPFENQQNKEVKSLLKFIKQELKSKFADDKILKRTAIVQFIGQLDAMEFEIDGQSKSALFSQFYNQKNTKMKIQKYKLQKGIDQNFLWRYPKPNIYPLKEDQIVTEVIKLNPLELNKLQEQFTEWGKRQQKQTWKNERICFTHRLKAHYLCENEIMNDKIYLCNRCISDKEQQQQQNRKIVCIKHKKPIKCKMSPKQGRVGQLQQTPEKQGEQQTFMCEQCLFYNHQKYYLVCCCHYQAIVELCIQQHCAEIGEFMICKICLQSSNSKHEHHRKVKFDRESLMNQFGFEGTINISAYEAELIKTKELLKLSPFQKIRISFAEKTISTIRFLKSFAVYKEAKVSKRINVFMSGGKREDLMVLRGVQNIKQELLSESGKRSYLQAFNYVLQGELSAMFEGIWQRILHSCERINKLKNANKSEVIAELNKKYKQISDIETDERVIAFPMRLSDVNPIHHSRIQRITVLKEIQAQRDDKIRKEFRDKKVKFFAQQIRRKLIEAQVGAQQQREIIQLFSKAEEYQLGRLADKIQEQNELYKYRTTIQSLSQTYWQIKDQFTAKLGECLPWSLMVSNEFSSLRVLRIQYAPKYHFNIFETEEYYSYSIDAFALFGFINGNAQLESVALKGIQISKMQQFVETLDPNNPDPYSMRKKEESEWLKARRPWTNLRLTLQSAYQLHPYFGYFNASPFAFGLSALSYFQRQFQSLSGMTVVIWFEGKDWGGHLEGLLQCLGAIKEIKIEIRSNHQPFLLLPLLKGLSSFTEITSLQFHRIRLQPQKSGAQLSKNELKESLSLLFESNAVAHLKLYFCNNFPALPRIATLRSIDLNSVSFWGEFDLGEFVQANRELRLIRIQSMEKQYMCEIGEEILNQLQYLSAYIQQNCIRFGPISSPSPSKLKYLQINNYNRIDANSLKPIFAKLAHLTQLKLSRFHFGYQLLSAIPSNSLEELSIWNNNTITDADLQLTDCKWPYLREIYLYDCPQISERMLRLCKFKGLMQIKVDRGVLSVQGRKHLRGRGIRVE